MPISFYSLLWRSDGGDPFWELAVRADLFTANYNDRIGRGLRLADLSTHMFGGVRYWALLWRPGAQEQLYNLSLDAQAFSAANATNRRNGWRLKCLRPYAHRERWTWAALWEPGIQDQQIELAMSASQLEANDLAFQNQGYRLVDLVTYTLGPDRKWAGLWEPGTQTQHWRVGLAVPELRTLSDDLAGQGLRLRLIRSYWQGGRSLVAAVWQSGDHAELWSVNRRAAQVRDDDAGAATERLKLAAITVLTDEVRASLPIHLRVLVHPTVGHEDMMTAAEEVYGPVGIQIEQASFAELNLPTFAHLDVGQCRLDLGPTNSQAALFANRGQIGGNEVVVYFVAATRPNPLNGCAVHPTDAPGAVVTQAASRWTLAHEVGHVLGLEHVTRSDSLMTDGGTASITNPPPDLDDSEIATLLGSPRTLKVQ